MTDYESATVVDEDDAQPFRPDPTPLDLLAEIARKLAWTNALLFFATSGVFALIALTLLGIVSQMAGCAAGVAR